MARGSRPAGPSPSEARGDAAMPLRVVDGYRVEISPGFEPAQAEDLRRLIDPASAAETVHWGRNYLYRARYAAADGDVEVVVKQFRPARGARRRLETLRGGPGKARKSWQMAQRFLAAGIPTAEPVALFEATSRDRASYFVTRHLGETIEARYPLRAANAGTLGEEFPQLDHRAFLTALGRLARRMHDAGLFHRDLSIGNVLLATGDGATMDDPRLLVVDLNRARQLPRLGVVRRSRDLCRLAIFRPEDRRLFLASYSEGDGGVLLHGLYLLFHYGFRAKRGVKDRWRSLGERLRSWLLTRSTHAHIPAAPPGAAARDRAVWDHLSDQPHHHAGRYEKLAIRLADAPSHLRHGLTLARVAPGIVRRYRALRGELFARPTSCDGIGICLRPLPEAREELLSAVAELGVRHILLRLHPWEGRYDEEEALARQLVADGRELVFAVPQNRDLVRDPARWRRELEEIARRFAPLGRHFQVGQAINRSKWGTWTHGEYLELATIAAEVLREVSPEVEIVGPGVIDFEPQATAAVVNARAAAAVRFDVLGNLLYVDRRGAPESPQLGFDTPRKLALLRAIAETAKYCGPRSWVTEVNWPLWEGPHSPAGRAVSVDEATQAIYLARYYLLALASGMVERIYWWQLVARGYGLASMEDAIHSPQLRRRASFAALRTLAAELRGARFEERLPSPAGSYLLRFSRPGGELVAGWSLAGEVTAELPRPASRQTELLGDSYASETPAITLRPSARYFALATL